MGVFYAATVGRNEFFYKIRRLVHSILAKKQQKMLFFEKVNYWGLKDPLEVRVQHETCIYMRDTFSSHFEPKKIDRVGRRGQKQPKLGIFGTSKNTPFWLF